LNIGKINQLAPEMFLKLVIFAIVFSCVAAADIKWAWKNIVESQCDNCKCYNKGHSMKLKPLRSLFAERRYVAMANKLSLSHLSIGFGNRGMITTDQDLYELAPFTFKKHFSKDMKKSYGNWTYGETSTGSVVNFIQKNVFRYQLKTHASRTIQKNADSLFGDGSSTYKVIWADGKSILLVGCFGSKGYSGWALYSTSRSLSRTTKEIVLEKISALGFKRSGAVVLPY